MDSIRTKKIKEVLDEVKDELKKKKERTDYFDAHYYRYFYTLEALLKVLENSRCDKCKILDVGCIPGHLSHALKKMGHDVYGISYKVNKINLGIQIEECNVEDDSFPFEDSLFDVVIFTEVMEHLIKSPVPALKEIHRVLKKGGYLILTTPNQLYIVRRILTLINILLFRSYMGNIDNLKKRFLEIDSVYETHHYKYTIEECKALLRWTNFKIIDYNYLQSWERIRVGERAGKTPIYMYTSIKSIIFIITKLIPQLRSNLLVVAQK